MVLGDSSGTRVVAGLVGSSCSRKRSVDVHVIVAGWIWSDGSRSLDGLEGFEGVLGGLSWYLALFPVQWSFDLHY